MFWTPRKHVHVDRVACPMLISRFIDKDAQFIFLPKEEILDFAGKTGAIPFDTPGAEIFHFEQDGVKYCSFDSLIEKYNLTSDPALQKVQEIVRAADTGKVNDFSMALRLEAIVSGTPLLAETDHDALVMEFPVYDI